MTAPYVPVNDTNDLADTKSQALYNALKKVNLLRQKHGFTVEELDAYLLDHYGLTVKALTSAVKAMPKETNPESVLTGNTLHDTALALKAEAYGASVGFTAKIEAALKSRALKGTGYEKAKAAAESEMRKFEKENPVVARSLQAVGLGGASVLGGKLLQTGAQGLLSMLAPAAAAAPAATTALPLLGEGVIEGSSIAPAAASAAPKAASLLTRTIKLLGPGIGVGYGAKKLKDYLTSP